MDDPRSWESLMLVRRSGVAVSQLDSVYSLGNDLWQPIKLLDPQEREIYVLHSLSYARRA